jgi:NADPH-dependent 2,4-dienoyl-CoA reductase/sulfur reductase-like enzyme
VSSDESATNGIVIVGGGLAAARTAEQLRKSEYSGPITIVSDEAHLPYDRPPLSKEVLPK